MESSLQIDKKAFYALALVIVAAATIVAFGTSAIDDSGYGLLLKSGMTADAARAASMGLFLALPLAVYLAGVYLLRANEFHAFVAAALFAFAAMNMESVYAIAPMLGTVLGEQHTATQIVSSCLLIAALGAFTIIEYKKDMAPAALAGLGIILMPFAPGVGIFTSAIAASKGLGMLEAHEKKHLLIVAAVLAFVFQGAYAGDLASALALSLMVAALAYVVLSLHNAKEGDVAALLMAFLAFEIVVGLYSIFTVQANALAPQEIAGYAYAKGLGGSVGVLDYPMAFQYYTGKQPVYINASQLIAKGNASSKYVLLSARALDAAYGDRPVVFAYAGTGTITQSQITVAIFQNRRYGLQMRLNSGELSVDDAVLFDYGTGESALVPFTRVRPAFNLTFSNPENRMVNTQETGQGALYSLLFQDRAVFENNGTKVVEVR